MRLPKPFRIACFAVRDDLSKNFLRKLFEDLINKDIAKLVEVKNIGINKS